MVQFQLLQCFHQFAYTPVKLGDGITTRSHTCNSLEAFVWETGNMDIIGSKVHEERLILMPFDKFYGMRSDGIGNVFIFPQCFTAALHITDSTDAIYDGHIMTMTRFLVIKQFRIVASGRFAFKVFLITHFNRSRFIVIGYLTILDKHTRNTVARCGHNVMIIKPQIAQRGREGSVPILLACLVAQSQMPLAECSGSISCTLEHVGHCILGWTDNHPCITGRNIGIRFAPGIFSGQ